MDIGLYDYQHKAINQMKSGSILCGDVGSGKSRTSLAYYYVKECGGTVGVNTTPMKKPKNLYIITTAKKRDDKEWEDELEVFSLFTDISKNPNNITIVIDSWNNIKKYKEVQDSFFIFDEQRVVGSGSWVKAFLRIAKFNHWILLSATPGDTWMDYVPVFIANSYYKNRTEFIARHVVYSRFSKYPKVSRYMDEGRLLKIRKDILVEMDYKKKAESIDKRVIADYDKVMYKLIMKKRWNIYKDEPLQDASSLYYTLRRLVNSSDERIEIIKRLILSHPKTIIFYNFDYEVEILRQIGEDLDICHAEWNGHKHERVPTGDRWTYFVQYTAGAEGWNCITTDTMIFFSQSYSYKATVQAAGRINRNNTPFKTLYYYHVLSMSPIDLAIEKALKQKKDFNESSFVES